jgi:hypothetical protein
VIKKLPFFSIHSPAANQRRISGMKRFIVVASLVALFTFICLSATALPPYQPYGFVRSFSTDLFPLPIAVDVTPTSTTCYYATFNGTTSRVWMVRDFMTSTGPADQTQISGNVSFYAGRGFQGVALDSTGKLYASGDSSGSPGLSNHFQRYIPNGTKTVWSLDGSFAPSTTPRFSGCALINDNLLVVANTTAAASFIKALDGSSSGTLPANTNYGREATFIPDNNDVYIAHNDNGVTTPSLSIYIDGDPGNLAAYTKETDAALGGSAPSGSATQHNGYDPVNKRLLHVNMRPAGNRSVEVYALNTPTRGAATIQKPPLQVISTYQEYNPGLGYWETKLLADIGDVAAIHYGGKDYLLITNSNSSKIFVFAPAPTIVTDWELY